MTLAEIMQKITELSAEERALLRRELEQTLSKPEAQEVTPETAKALGEERIASGDERGLPIEDVLGQTNPGVEKGDSSP
jgi:hypothetical protein